MIVSNSEKNMNQYNISKVEKQYLFFKNIIVSIQFLKEYCEI